MLYTILAFCDKASERLPLRMIMYLILGDHFAEVDDWGEMNWFVPVSFSVCPLSFKEFLPTKFPGSPHLVSLTVSGLLILILI